MKVRVAFTVLFGLALMVSLSTRSHAQPRQGGVPETDDEVKVNTYKKFVDNREPNPTIAYQAAKDYMTRYGKEDDQYTRYLKQWIAAYEEDERNRKLAAEREDREQRLLGAITQQKFADAYGLAKQVLNDDPNNVKVLIPLGYSGVLASTETRVETFNAEAANYAQKAIQLIESGKSPDSWSPFKNKEDVLASLQYALGFYALKSAPESAIGHFIKAAQIDSDRKTAPSTYFYLAAAYQNGPYKKLSDDYSKRYGNQPESPESKAALDNVNKVLDKMIDAYARAVALAGSDPQHQAAKTQWLARLTDLYKFRHNGSDAGLTEFIAGILSQPLPQ
jgi:tetratricopeptide (TPR) repeat protein